MLFVDGWFSVNVDPLICGIEEKKKGVNIQGSVQL